MKESGISLINEGFINIRFEEIVTRMKREIKILDQLSEFRRTQVRQYRV